VCLADAFVSFLLCLLVILTPSFAPDIQPESKSGTSQSQTRDSVAFLRIAVRVVPICVWVCVGVCV